MIASPRRYYLLKRLEAGRQGDSAMQGVWRSKQEGQASTALPVDFPLLAQLSAVGYSTQLDLDGADVDELTSPPLSLSPSEAEAVLAAFEAL